jgi:hypothetical protein
MCLREPICRLRTENRLNKAHAGGHLEEALTVAEAVDVGGEDREAAREAVDVVDLGPRRSARYHECTGDAVRTRS